MNNLIIDNIINNKFKLKTLKVNNGTFVKFNITSNLEGFNIFNYSVEVKNMMSNKIYFVNHYKNFIYNFKTKGIYAITLCFKNARIDSKKIYVNNNNNINSYSKIHNAAHQLSSSNNTIKNWRYFTNNSKNQTNSNTKIELYNLKNNKSKTNDNDKFINYLNEDANFDHNEFFLFIQNNFYTGNINLKYSKENIINDTDLKYEKYLNQKSLINN